MLYRTFPKIPGVEISVLSFGCMRLPTVGKDPARIDEPAATRLLREAIDAGVNYVDTAQPYHAGNSEPFVGRALKGALRSKVHLATKLPIWLVKERGDFERLLSEQLERLQTDHIDFYLLHALNDERWDLVLELGGLEIMEKARAEGRIRHLGFSFHGTPRAFKKIVDGYSWEFCQIQYNLLDESYQAGHDGLVHAGAQGIGVVVMEPLRGGVLARPAPEVARIWERAGTKRTPAQWALRWVWRRPEVVTVLSGMNATSQLAENLAAAAESSSALHPEELAVVEDVRRFYQEKTKVPCTTCGYCLPCPQDVSIPDVLSLYNAVGMFGSKAGPAGSYRNFYLNFRSGADVCGKCGECLPKCPQGINVPMTLEEAHRCLTTP